MVGEIREFFQREEDVPPPLPAVTPEESERAMRTAKTAAVTAVPRMLTAPGELAQIITTVAGALREKTGDVVKNMARARYRNSPGGFEKVEARIQEEGDKIRAANPGLSDDEVNKKLSVYQNTPEHVDFERQFIPYIFKKNEELGDKINDYFGVPRDVQQTNTENVLGGVAQAITPTGFVKGAIKSAPRAVRWAIELAAPGLQHVSGKSAAIATGLSAGIGAGANTLTNRDVGYDEFEQQKIRDAKAHAEDLKQEIGARITTPPSKLALNNPEINEVEANTVPVDTSTAEQDGKDVATFTKLIPGAETLAVFGAFGAMLTGQRIKTNAAHAGNPHINPGSVHPRGSAGTGGAVPPVPPAPPPTGGGGTGIPPVPPTAPTTKPSPTLGGTLKYGYDAANFALDERTPVQNAIRAAGASRREAIQGANEVGIHSASAAGTAKKNHNERGFIGNMQVTPIKEMDSYIDAMNNTHPDYWPRTRDYLHARTEITDRLRYVDEIDTKMTLTSTELQVAVRNQDAAKVRDLTSKLVDLRAEKQNRLNTRFTMANKSLPELQQMVRDGPDMPGDNLQLGSRYADAFDENNQAMLKTPVDMHVIEPVTAQAIAQVHGSSYAPKVKDKMEGAKGWARVWGGIQEKFDPKDPLRNVESQTGLYLRRALDPDASQIEHLLDPHIAMKQRIDSFHSWTQKELYKQKTMGRVLAGATPSKVISKVLTSKQGTTAFNSKQIARMKAKGVPLHEYTPVRLRGDNGKVTFYKFHDPLFTATMNPVPTTPTVMSAMKHAFQRGTTGPLQVGVTPMLAGLEARGIMQVKPVGHVGPIGRYVHWGVEKVTGKQVGEKTLHAIDTAPVVMTANQLLSGLDMVSHGTKLWWQENRLRMADALSTSLKTSNGWFNMMQKNPGFKQWLAKYSANVVDTFNHSLQATAMDRKTITYGTLTKNLEHTNVLESIADNFRIKGKNGKLIKVGKIPFKIVGEFFNQIRIATSAMRDAVKEGYLVRNMSYLELKYGGMQNIPDAEIDKLHNQVRTATGDMTRRAGSQAMQTFDDTVPFWRVTLQAQKNMWQRLTSEPILLYSFLTGLVIPKIAAEFEFNHWDDDAYDWYYRQQTFNKRAMSIPIIDPTIVYRRRVLGEKIPFDPKYVHNMFNMQEYRPLVEAVVQGARALGIYNAGQEDKTVAPTMGDQFWDTLTGAAGQSAVPSTSPVTNAILANRGIRTDTGNLFGEDHVIEVNGDKNRVNKSIVQDSFATNGMIDTLGAVFGQIARNMIEGYTTGEQNFKRGSGIGKSVWEGTKEFGQRQAQSSAEVVPFGSRFLPWASDAISARRYRQTAVSNELYKNREAFTVLGGRGVGDPAFQTEDPLLEGIVDELKLVSKDFEPKDFTDRYKEISKEINSINNNRTVEYKDRLALTQDKYKQLHELSVEQQEWMLEQQKNIANMEIRPGMNVATMFKQQYKKDFSLQNFATVVKDIKNKQGKQ